MNYSIERKEEDQKTICCWKSLIESKRQPIQGDIPVNVVKAICRYYEVEFRPAVGYEKVTDRIVACFPWLKDDERAQWKRMQWRVAFTGPSVAPSTHSFGKATKNRFPRLHILCLSSLFGPPHKSSKTLMEWIARNKKALWFVSDQQEPSILPLLLKHREAVRTRQGYVCNFDSEEENAAEWHTCSSPAVLGADRQLSIASFMQPKTKAQEMPDSRLGSAVNVTAFYKRLQAVNYDVTMEQEEMMKQLIKEEFKHEWENNPETCLQVLLQQTLRKLIQAGTLDQHNQEPAESCTEDGSVSILDSTEEFL